MLRDFKAVPSPHAEAQYEPLEGFNDFPLFEMAARLNLLHVLDTQSYADLRTGKANRGGPPMVGRTGY